MLLPLSFAPEEFLSLAPILPCRRHPPPHPLAAGRAMVHTYGSEPSVNQKVFLPSFKYSYGVFHADQCYAVSYAILTPPGGERREVGRDKVCFFLAGRGNIRGEKAVAYGTQFAPLSPSTPGQEIAMGAGERRGGDQTLIVCAAIFIPREDACWALCPPQTAARRRTCGDAVRHCLRSRSRASAKTTRACDWLRRPTFVF